VTGPHQGQPLETTGTPVDTAEAAVVLVHGRGATARSILAMADEVDRPGVAFLAPQAAHGTWYPNSFMAPVESNEPGLSSGLQAVDDELPGVTLAGALARTSDDGVLHHRDDRPQTEGIVDRQTELETVRSCIEAVTAGAMETPSSPARAVSARRRWSTTYSTSPPSRDSTF
jgi:hypothetical protein